MYATQTTVESPKAGDTPNWYALFTRHQHEKAVATALSNKGHEIYVPLYRSVRRWQGRAKYVALPLFPCYAFIREGMDRPLQILTTPGVLQIVGYGGRPATISLAQLDAVRQIVESGLSVETHAYLQCGDRVRIKSGPLVGLEGILARKKDSVRLVVSLDMLGRSAAVEVDVLNVERIGPLPSQALPRNLSASA